MSVADQEVLCTKGCIFTLQDGLWKDEAIGNLKLVLDLRTLDIHIVATSVDQQLVSFLLTSRVRSKGPRAWVLKAQTDPVGNGLPPQDTSADEILAIRFGTEGDSAAFKDFMEHAYALDRKMISSRSKQISSKHSKQRDRRGGRKFVTQSSSSPDLYQGTNARRPARFDRNNPTSISKHKIQSSNSHLQSTTLATDVSPAPVANMDQSDPNNQFKIGHNNTKEHVSILPLTQANLRQHNKNNIPKRRHVQDWIRECEKIMAEWTPLDNG